MSIFQIHQKSIAFDEDNELLHPEIANKTKGGGQNNSLRSLVIRKTKDKQVSQNSKKLKKHPSSGSCLSTSLSSFPSSLCAQQPLSFAAVLSIPYSPRDTKEYFLCNDVFIEFDLDATSEQAFETYKNLQNTLRPISCIKFLKESSFLILQFDERQRGISDFSFIIHQLKSLQNSALFQLARSLELYVSLMNISRTLDAHLSPEEQTIRKLNNKEQLQGFIEQTMPQILSQLDKEKFMIFLLYDMTDGYHDQTRKLYGMNEKYISLFGSSVDHLTSQYFKQGWFNQTQFADRNRQSIEYFCNIKALYESQFDLSKIQIESDYEMVTVEGIQVPVKLKPTPCYCYSSTYQDPLNKSKQLLIGILHLMEIELTADSKKIIREARSNKCGMMSCEGKNWEYGGIVETIQKRSQKVIHEADYQDNLVKGRKNDGSKENKNEAYISYSSSSSTTSPSFSGSFQQINEQQDSRHRQCSFQVSNQQFPTNWQIQQR